MHVRYDDTEKEIPLTKCIFDGLKISDISEELQEFWKAKMHESKQIKQ